MNAEELEHSVTSSISDRLAGAVGTLKANSASEKVGVVPAIRSEMVFGFAALSSEPEQVFLGVRFPKGSLQSGGMAKKFFCSLNAKSSTTIGSSESALIAILSYSKVQHSIGSVSLS